MKRTFGSIFLIFLALGFAMPVFAQDTSDTATNTPQDTVTTVLAQIVSIQSTSHQVVAQTQVSGVVQQLSAEILEGPDTGRIVSAENDYTDMSVGEKFYMSVTTNGIDGSKAYAALDPYRLPQILFFIGLFIVVVVLFGGMQGLRGLLSLGISLFIILYVLLPAILHGYSAIWMSIGVSGVIVILGSYITHGFNRTTSAAVLGMLVTIVLTGILAYVAVQVTHLSGFSTEETVYLNMSTQGSINFVGLLLGGILIGLLGILYDVSIGQAVSVEELYRAAPDLPRKKIFERAVRIGREHIGALVNTLALAYVGVALPLLLLYLDLSTNSIAQTINREIFATEIIRAVIGSIGLVLAVPITSFIAVWFLMKKDESPELTKKSQ